MKPETYKVQSGCYNCKKCFAVERFDASTLYYCHQDKSERPLCGERDMGEGFYDLETPHDIYTDENMEIAKKLSDLWREWSEPRSVSRHGICDIHEQK